MQNNRDAGQERLVLWAARVILAAGIIFGVWLVFRYCIGILLPFLLAWLMSCAIRPLVRRMVGQSRMPRGLAAGVLVVLFISGLSGLALWGCGRGLEELGKLMEGLSREDAFLGGFFYKSEDILASVAEHLPFLRSFVEHPAFASFCQGLDDLVREAAGQALTTMGQKVPAALLSVVGSLPSVFIFVTSLLLSCYYFSADDGSLWQGFLAHLPRGWGETCEKWRKTLALAAGRYVRAYLILGLVTFVEMFLGLTILKVPYAFLLAWVIALVDFLPLLGAGTILLPWAGVVFLMGDVRLSLGLLILFGVSSLLRQFIEPRLVSAGLGLHPLLSLVAVFAGWKLFGVPGMLLAPFVVLVVKALWQGNDKAEISN